VLAKAGFFYRSLLKDWDLNSLIWL